MITKRKRSKVMAVDTLIGDYVTTTEGEIVGKLENIVLEVSSGCIAYAVLSLEENQGMGDVLCAIPWRVLKLDKTNNHFTLKADKEYLEKSPRFDFKAAWPKAVNCDLVNKIHS